MTRLVGTLLYIMSYGGIIFQNYCDMWAGFYYYNDGQIVICNHYKGLPLSYDDRVQILFHEMGHRFYYREMSLDNIRQREDIHNASSVFITEYASTSAEEDFAEMFRWVIGKQYRGEDVYHHEEWIKIKYDYILKLLRDADSSHNKVIMDI